MIDIKELEHLAPMANEMLSGLHADEAMKRRILFAANEKNKRRAPMPRLVPALCCAALAFVLALAAGRWPVVEVLLRPYVLAIKAVPVASFIILALIWMRTSALPLFISFLMVFPILYTNVLAGLRSADGQLLEMARAFRVPWRRQRIAFRLGERRYSAGRRQRRGLSHAQRAHKRARRPAGQRGRHGQHGD